MMARKWRRVRYVVVPLKWFVAAIAGGALWMISVQVTRLSLLGYLYMHDLEVPDIAVLRAVHWITNRAYVPEGVLVLIAALAIGGCVLDLRRGRSYVLHLVVLAMFLALALGLCGLVALRPPGGIPLCQD